MNTLRRPLTWFASLAFTPMVCALADDLQSTATALDATSAASGIPEPIAITEAPADVTGNSATLIGRVLPNGVCPTVARFGYWIGGLMPYDRVRWTAEQPLEGTNWVTLMAEISLPPSTRCWYQIAAYGGGCAAGGDYTVFTTPSLVHLRLVSQSCSASESGGLAALTVLRTGPAAIPVSVRFVTGAGSAQPGEDYVDTNGIVSFAAGEMTKTLEVAIFPDSETEGDETFTVSLVNPSNGAELISPSAAVVMIFESPPPTQLGSVEHLRAAVGFGGAYTFDRDLSISLADTLVVCKDLTLDAAGHNVTLSGAQLVPLFFLQPGRTLSLKGLSLADGLAQGVDGDLLGDGWLGAGGAVRSEEANLTAENCTFLRNGALGGRGGEGVAFDENHPSGAAPGAGGPAQGGAIWATGGTLNLTNALFLGNWVRGGPGGSMRDCGPSGLPCTYLGGNGGNASGGAIWALGSIVNIAQSQFLTNTAWGGEPGTGLGDGASGTAWGGALCNAGSMVTLLTSLLASNVATGDGRGGAILNLGELSVLNSTFTRNLARAGTAGGTSGQAYGGALCNDHGTSVLTHVTMSANSAAQGGALWTVGGAAVLQNTLLGNSMAGGCCFGPITDAGHNISSDDSCNLTALGSLNNTELQLGPLADYGGPTPTMSLLAGSPALDAADPAFALPTDQRGRARPYGAECDVGAFESSPPYTIQGWITGYQPPAGSLLISAGAIAQVIGAGGAYFLDGFAPGDCLVRPQAPDAVFVSSDQLVTLGPDAIASFHSYRSNAFTLERSGPGMLRVVFAAAREETWRVFSSTNLPVWTPYATNTTPSSGLFDFPVPSDSPRRFFQGEMVPQGLVE